jgi:hypothetical protein
MHSSRLSARHSVSRSQLASSAALPDQIGRDQCNKIVRRDTQ